MHRLNFESTEREVALCLLKEFIDVGIVFVPVLMDDNGNSETDTLNSDNNVFERLADWMATKNSTKMVCAFAWFRPFFVVFHNCAVLGQVSQDQPPFFVKCAGAMHTTDEVQLGQNHITVFIGSNFI